MEAEDDFLQQATRQAKRRFLMEEIVETGYLPATFTYYCELSKGSDLDQWTFEELQDAVKRFKAEFRPGQEPPGTEADQTAPPEAQESAKGTSAAGGQPAAPPIQSKPAASQPPTTEVEGAYTLPAHPLPPTELSECRDLRISLGPYSPRSPEEVQGGLVSQGYTNFVVNTSPVGWSVKRRFTDFQWLRGTLMTQFPGYLVPPLPEKSKLGLSTSVPNSKRVAFLTHFLMAIANSPLLLRSSFLQAFLKEASNDQFQSVKKKLKKLESLTEFPSLTDSLTICPLQMTEQFQQVNEFLSRSEMLKKRLKHQVDCIINTTKALARDVENLAQTLQLLATLPNTLSEDEKSKWNYESFATAAFQWSKCESEMAAAYEEHLEMFWKYRYVEMREARELLKQRESHLAAYLKAAERLQTKKEKQGKEPGLVRGLLHKTTNASKLGPEDEEAVQVLKSVYGYFNHTCNDELRRMCQHCTQQETLTLSDFSATVELFLQRLALAWRTLSSKLSAH